MYSARKAPPWPKTRPGPSEVASHLRARDKFFLHLRGPRRLAQWNRERMEPIRDWMFRRLQDSEARRVREFLSTAVVVFHCTEEQAAAIDVSVGPCVLRVGPRGGRFRPLASPHSQYYSQTLTQLAALYTLLTDLPESEALEDLRQQGPGTLARLANRFVVELVELGTVHADVESVLAAQAVIAARWLAAVEWHPTMRGLEHRVLAITGTARLAQEKGHPVYCWHGPAVAEYVLARGVGTESYEAYRRAKHR